MQNKGIQRAPSEASLRGHLKNDTKDGKESTGSSSYVPREAEQDTQLQYALKLLRGEIQPPSPTQPSAPEASITPKGQPKTK